MSQYVQIFQSIFKRFPMVVKQSQIVQRYTTVNHIIPIKHLEDTYRGSPMHFQRSTPQDDSRMFRTDFPIISFAQNQTRARKTRPYAVDFAANTSSAGGCARTTAVWRSICSTCAATVHAWPCALPAAKHFLANLLWQRAAFGVVFVPSLHYPCFGDVFYHSGFLTQSRETSASARCFAVPRAVVLQIQHAPHGVALQLSSAAAVPCLSRIPADVVRPYVYAIQLRGTTLHIRDIGLFRSFVFWCAYS